MSAITHDRIAPSETETADEKERFHRSLGKCLNHVGVTSQQEIERFVREHGLEGRGTKPKVKIVAYR